MASDTIPVLRRTAVPQVLDHVINQEVRHVENVQRSATFAELREQKYIACLASVARLSPLLLISA